jgi:hypothetical protein
MDIYSSEREHSGNVQGTFRGKFRERSGHYIQGPFRDHSGHLIQGTLRALHSGNVQGTYWERSQGTGPSAPFEESNGRGTFREHSGRIQGTLSGTRAGAPFGERVTGEEVAAMHGGSGAGEEAQGGVLDGGAQVGTCTM